MILMQQNSILERGVKGVLAQK